MVLIPLTYIFLIKPVFFGGSLQVRRSGLKNCDCSVCEDKITERAKVYKFSYVNNWFFVRMGILVVLWALWYHCFDIVKDIEPLKTFIPHELLGVEQDATVA